MRSLISGVYKYYVKDRRTSRRWRSYKISGFIFTSTGGDQCGRMNGPMTRHDLLKRNEKKKKRSSWKNIRRYYNEREERLTSKKSIYKRKLIVCSSQFSFRLRSLSSQLHPKWSRPNGAVRIAKASESRILFGKQFARNLWSVVWTDFEHCSSVSLWRRAINARKPTQSINPYA